MLWGMAGKGVPSPSMRFIRVVRSVPVSVSVDWPFSPPCTSWRVMTPSISTSGVPFMVTMMMTRMKGTRLPPVSRNRVCSGDFWLNWKVSWKPLGVRGAAEVVTWMLVSASSTAWGTGTGTVGPMSRVTLTPLSIGQPRDAFRQGDAQAAADDLG